MNLFFFVLWKATNLHLKNAEYDYHRLVIPLPLKGIHLKYFAWLLNFGHVNKLNHKKTLKPVGFFQLSNS